MNAIPQTNRTIFYDEINPQVPNLLTLIGSTRNKDSLTDDEIKIINEHLLCENFQEFLAKLSPTIYSFFSASDQRVLYTTKKPEHIPDEMLTEIPLNSSNSFFKMIETLIDTKRSQGIINVDFKFENILDLISPKKIMDDIHQLRREMSFTFDQYEKLEEGDPQKLDVGDKLNVLFEEASTNYNNVMAMLPIAIEDIKTRLLLTGGGDDATNTKFVLGTLQIGSGGELKVIEAPKEAPSNSLALLEDVNRTQLVTALEEDYDYSSGEAAPAEGSTSYVKDLVVRTFAPLAPGTTSTSLDVKQEIANYNTYLDFYKKSNEEFIKVARPLLEKIAGIKMFFDQYTVKKDSTMRPKLLIANVTPDMLSRSNNVPRLITYLNTVNAKNDYSNSIWYAILPNVALERKDEIKVSRQRFKGNIEPKLMEVNTLESLSRLVDVSADFRIPVFFSFESSPKTTFDYMATEGISIYEERCKPLMGKKSSEFAIPSIPNLTIVPKDKSGVRLDTKMVVAGKEGEEFAQMSKAEEDMAKLWLEGIYLGGAYIAAGITAAWQDPEYLKQIFRKNVSRNYPGVRFDIEQDDHALLVTTTLPREITGFTSTVKDNINSRNFGFVFSSENARVNGMPLSRIAVYKARNILLDESTGAYVPIYKTIHTTYIDRMLRYHTQDYKEDNVRAFFSNNPESQKSVWGENSQREYYNSILHIGDDINYEIDNQTGACTVNIEYKGNVRNLDVDIKRSVADAIV